jgi:hypothetical protein
MVLASMCYFRQIPAGVCRDRFASALTEEVHPGLVYPMRCRVAPRVRISEDRNLPFAVLVNKETHAPHQCPILE